MITSTSTAAHGLSHVHCDPASVRTQPVVLDVGGGIGALIVYTDPERLGLEVEISPA